MHNALPLLIRAHSPFAHDKRNERRTLERLKISVPAQVRSIDLLH